MASIFDDTIAVDYTKSTFSIAADNLTLKLIGGSLVMLLMLGWVVWFFFAHLTFYETSLGTWQPNGVIVAQFSSESLLRLNYEQPAFFQTQNSSGQIVSVPIQIVKIDAKSGQVELWPLAEEQPAQTNTQPVHGQVKVGVEQVTPATLILRAAGLNPS